MVEIIKLNNAYPSQATALWDSGLHEAHDAITPAALYELRTTKNFRDRPIAHMSQTFCAGCMAV